MKTLVLLGSLFLSIVAFGQTSEKKNNFSFGGGKQCYNGDLGNSWFAPQEEYYGFFGIDYSRYICKSFDANLAITYGDLGHCREEDEKAYRPDGTYVLNMLARLTTTIVSVRYKFANGYILKEDSKLAPYIFVGGGYDNITNTWPYLRTKIGNYASLNGGLGARYNITKKFNLNYNLDFGYFTSDNTDLRSEGMNDAYMQHTLSIGVNF